MPYNIDQKGFLLHKTILTKPNELSKLPSFLSHNIVHSQVTAVRPEHLVFRHLKFMLFPHSISPHFITTLTRHIAGMLLYWLQGLHIEKRKTQKTVIRYFSCFTKTLMEILVQIFNMIFV